jgi:hypothetical protein
MQQDAVDKTTQAEAKDNPCFGERIHEWVMVDREISVSRRSSHGWRLEAPPSASRQNIDRLAANAAAFPSCSRLAGGILFHCAIVGAPPLRAKLPGRASIRILTRAGEHRVALRRDQ